MKDRVLMAYPSSQIPFLPTFEDFLRLTGFGAGLPGLIRDIAIGLDKVPPSQKTLKNAFTKPTTRSTANRILDIVDSKLPDVDLDKLSEQFRPWEELKLQSNGASWYPAILSFREYCLNDRYPNARAEKFIHDRINAEFQFLTEIKRLHFSSSGTKEDESLKDEALKRLLFEHTFVDKDLIETASSMRSSDPEAPRIEQQFWQDIRIDFYHNLISTLSLDIMERFKQLGIDSKNSDEIISDGLIGSLAPKLKRDGSIAYPFYQLLERWTKVFSDDSSKPLSWRALSKAMPHPSDERLLELDPDSPEYRDLWGVAMDTRKTRMREWCSGISPQDEQLERFVQNLVPEDKDGYHAWLIAHIAVIWGRLIDQEIANHRAGGELYNLSDSLIFRYRDTWRHYRDQAAAIMAT